MNWIEANQRYLTAALHEIRAILERHANAELPPAEPVEFPPFEPPMQPAVEILTERFGLSPFERQVLLLCAGVELDSSFSSLCATTQLNNLRQPTFSLALAAFPAAHWSAITPDAPLRRWRLIDVRDAGGVPLVSAPLSIDERILHFLCGIQQVDERLRGALQTLHSASPSLAASQEEMVARIAAVFGGDNAPAIQLCGADASETRAL
ncbi:MAG TPA: ATP-binding protein, partial [Thermoanaerobaculia bacterium]|nr:ATP-binding protein [Thermoanaerobaculia bacterium]